MEEMQKLKIKKGDTVIVNTGKDKGKQGKIEKVFSKQGKILVVGVNVAKKHLKPSRKSPHGGIIDKLLPIDSSNATIICPRCSKPTKVGFKLMQNSKGGSAAGQEKSEPSKIRICRKCKESLD